MSDLSSHGNWSQTDYSDEPRKPEQKKTPRREIDPDKLVEELRKEAKTLYDRSGYPARETLHTPRLLTCSTLLDAIADAIDRAAGKEG